MLVLLIPWLLLFLLIAAAILFFCKRFILGGSIFFIVVILNTLFECIPVRLCPINKEYNSKCISVFCFNIDAIKEGAEEKIPWIANLIKQYNPDLIFLSEYREKDYKLLGSCLSEIYPYSTNIRNIGHGFFSKYPLTPQQILKENDNDIGIYSTILSIGKNTVYVFGCHLASNNFTKDRNYLPPKNIDDLHSFFAYLKNISLASKKREGECELLIEKLKNRKPTIVMGDFNDIAGSSALNLLKDAELVDGWWNGGVGYGPTIHSPLPYRIDHIMFSKEITLKKIQVVPNGDFSDHDALYAVVEL